MSKLIELQFLNPGTELDYDGHNQNIILDLKKEKFIPVEFLEDGVKDVYTSRSRCTGTKRIVEDLRFIEVGSFRVNVGDPADWILIKNTLGDDIVSERVFVPVIPQKEEIPLDEYPIIILEKDDYKNPEFYLVDNVQDIIKYMITQDKNYLSLTDEGVKTITISSIDFYNSARSNDDEIYEYNTEIKIYGIKPLEKNYKNLFRIIQHIFSYRQRYFEYNEELENIKEYSSLVGIGIYKNKIIVRPKHCGWQLIEDEKDLIGRKITFGYQIDYIAPDKSYIIVKRFENDNGYVYKYAQLKSDDDVEGINYEYEKIYNYPIYMDVNEKEREQFVKEAQLNINKKVANYLKNNEYLQEVLNSNKYDDVMIKMEDSFAAGNCELGTKTFIKRFKLNENGVTIKELKESKYFNKMKRNPLFLNVIKYKIEELKQAS